MRKRKTKKLPFLILVILIVGVFGALYFFNGYFEKNNKKDDEPVPILRDEHEFSVTLAGNILINSNMWTDTIDKDGFNFDRVFEKTNDIMKKSDINFYFQQSIVGGSDLGASLFYNYNSPVDLLKSLSKMGFNATSLASYHAFDKGIKGITNSINNMANNKITYSGVSDTESKSKVGIIEVKGVKVGLLSYTIKTDENLTESYAVNIYSDELVKKDVESIKKDVKFIIVSIDFAGTNSNEVTEEQKRIANYISGLGVNVLVGNTGYSIQPIEKIDNMVVFYSLGNLLSGHTLIDSRISEMVDFNVKIVDDKVEIKDIKASLYYAYNLNNKNYSVIPFQQITTELSNYKTYYEKYKDLIKDSNVKVEFYNIGD